jgi:glycosyltransferase involved in cell wall biosynthesis
MKIGLISESPTVATGFGTHALHLVRLLAELGHETVVFAVCAQGLPFNPADYPCRIVPMPRDQKDAIERLGAFLAEERPDVLFVHYDLSAVCRFVQRARDEGWTGPVITHFVIDSMPFNRRDLDLLRTMQVGITPTYAAARYCASVGLDHVIAAPHPVDATIFQPLPNREDLRQAAGLANRFVVGVFGRNVERKQQPRVMLALQHLLHAGHGADIVLYVHCQSKQEDVWFHGWNLEEVAEQLGIAAQVLFPPQHFRQLNGIPYQPAADSHIPTSVVPTRPTIPEWYSYVERLNLCDLVVNVPYCGAFELATLEAQACGIPVAVTNDHGAIAEVAGDGAILLQPVDVAIHSSGGYQYFVGAQTIADAILAVKHEPLLRADLIRRGSINAVRYTIEPLRSAVRQACDMIEIH